MSERVESWIATTASKYWNEVVQSYINLFQPRLNRHNTGSQIALDVLQQK